MLVCNGPSGVTASKIAPFVLSKVGRYCNEVSGIPSSISMYCLRTGFNFKGNCRSNCCLVSVGASAVAFRATVPLVFGSGTVAVVTSFEGGWFSCVGASWGVSVARPFDRFCRSVVGGGTVGGIVLSRLVLVASVLVSYASGLRGARIGGGPAGRIILASGRCTDVTCSGPGRLSRSRVAGMVCSFGHVGSRFGGRFVAAGRSGPGVSVVGGCCLAGDEGRSHSTSSVRVGMPVFRIRLAGGDKAGSVAVIYNSRETPGILLFARGCRFSRPVGVSVECLIRVTGLGVLSSVGCVRGLGSRGEDSALSGVDRSLGVSGRRVARSVVGEGVAVVSGDGSERCGPVGNVSVDGVPSQVMSVMPPVSSVM